jgi:hypothetical protein
MIATRASGGVGPIMLEAGYDALGTDLAQISQLTHDNDSHLLKMKALKGHF